MSAVILDMQSRLTRTITLNDRIAQQLRGRVTDQRMHQAQARAARHVRNGKTEASAMQLAVIWALNAGSDPWKPAA